MVRTRHNNEFSFVAFSLGAYTYPFFQRILMSFDPRLLAYVESPICILAFDSIFVCYLFSIVVTLEFVDTLIEEAFVCCGNGPVVQEEFEIVCHEKVVRILLKGDKILRVHGERTQGVVKTLMNTKKGRVKLRRVRAMSMTIQSSVKDKILATPSETSKVENAPTEMLRDLDQQIEKRAYDGGTLWIKLYIEYEYEIRYHPGKANVVIDALSRKERVKPRRVRAMAMTIQYGVRGMILAAQSEAFKQENVLAERLHGKEWNSGDDQLRLRWMIYLVVLADAAESVRDTIGFEYCLASSRGWTKSPVLWAEIEESSLTGPEINIGVEVGAQVMHKGSPWKGVIRLGKRRLMDREVKSLKRSRILLVKVRWNSKRGPEFT
ncbi:hypothetical protein Tco_0969071 [Tanacetum coccineum]